MKFFIGILFCGLSFSLGGCQESASVSELSPEARVFVGDQEIRVTIADTPAERQQGLMYIDTLPNNTGMLFVFDELGSYSFWMKNTLIPLDVVWMDEQKTVVDIQTLQPCAADPCPQYAPKAPAQYVLEVAGGTFQGSVGTGISWEYFE